MEYDVEKIKKDPEYWRRNVSDDATHYISSSPTDGNGSFHKWHGTDS